MDLSINLDRIIFEVEFKTYLDYIEFMEQFLDTEQKKRRNLFTNSCQNMKLLI